MHCGLKCQIRKSSVKYVEHVVARDGLKVDPEKVRAMREMPEPKSKEDILRFLGFVQYIAKFIPGLSEVDGPLCELKRKDIDFIWEEPQQRSFDRLKVRLWWLGAVLQYPCKIDVVNSSFNIPIRVIHH